MNNKTEFQTDKVVAPEAFKGGEGDGAPPRQPCSFCGALLEPNGVRFGRNLIWAGYEKCGCVGARAAEETRRANEARAKEIELIKTRNAKLLRRGIPKRFLGARAVHPQAIRYLANAGNNTSRGLYVFGGVGRGKTSLASAIAIELFKQGSKFIFTGSQEMLEAIKGTFDTNEATAEVLAKFKTCDLLVIDDIGKESAKNWSISTVFSIVNARYTSMLPTIYTSQYSLADLQAVLTRSGEAHTAEAICSRIAETCEVIHLQGADLRRVKKN